MADAVQIKLKLENAQLAKDLRKSQQDFYKLEAAAKKSMGGVSSSAEKMGLAVGSALRRLAAPLAVITGLNAVKNSVIDVTTQIAALNDQANELGLSFQSFQKLDFAAGQAGVGADKLTAALGKMQATLGQMAETGADESLRKLGLTIAEVIDLPADEQFRMIAERLSNIENPAERAAAGVEIFGRGFRSLNPLIEDGAEGLDRAAEAAENFGAVLDEKASESLRRFDDNLDLLSRQWTVLKAGFFAPFTDYLNNLFAASLADAEGRVISLTDRIRILAGQDVSSVLGTNLYVKPSQEKLETIRDQAKAEYDAEEAAFQKLQRHLLDNQKKLDKKLSTAGASGVDRAAQLAKQAKDDAETYAKNFAEALSSSQFKTFEAGVDLASIGAENIDQIKLAVSLTKELADLQSGAFTKDHLANLEAEAIARYEINTAIIAGTEAIEKQQAAQEKSAKLLEALGTIAEAEAQRTQEMAEAISEPLIRAMDGVITGAISAQDAVKDLIRQLLIAVAQAALLAAFGQGSFGSNFSNIITGNRSATPQGGPTLRILNQSGGLVTTRRRSNGDTDLIIGQLAKAISTGGNQLDKAIRRTYGIGRQGV